VASTRRDLRYIGGFSQFRQRVTCLRSLCRKLDVKRYLVRLIRFHAKHTTAALRQELQVLSYVVSKQTVLRALHPIPTLALKDPRQRMALTNDQKAARLQTVSTVRFGRAN
jgi:hypothetical protein